jgi:kynurenine formamidase
MNRKAAPRRRPAGAIGIVLSLLAGAVGGAGCGDAPAPADVPPPASVGQARTAALPAGTIVDLTHPFNADTIFWPTADPFRLDPVAAGMTEAGYYYAANTFVSAEHGGTHLDAPVHFAEGRHTVDEIPLERLVGPAVVIDVTAAAAADADYQVSVADFDAWEREHGRLPDGVVVLLRTGFAARWPDAARYLGTAERGEAAVADLHFPGLHPDAARWLVDERQVGAVGLDTASIDHGQSTAFESHRILYERNIPAFENLAALDALPPAGTFIVALPMLIEGGSGAPLRAIAIVPRPAG